MLLFEYPALKICIQKIYLGYQYMIYPYNVKQTDRIYADYF